MHTMYCITSCQKSSSFALKIEKRQYFSVKKLFLKFYDGEMLENCMVILESFKS